MRSRPVNRLPVTGRQKYLAVCDEKVMSSLLLAIYHGNVGSLEKKSKSVK